ncbi:MAG TPA: sigma-70 family RNA polymerase sigma factor [Clostridia bacterium]|nr:sigma-70 family RNA polymerase sigma factor [Clostridia bacterium]
MNIKWQTDFNLVDRYLCGDEAAGNELYSNVIPRVKKYIFAQIKGSSLSPADTEDILMNTLRTSIEKLSSYNGSSSFLTFVIGIARNKVLQATKSDSHPISTEPALIEQLIDQDSAFISTSNKGLGENPLGILIRKEAILAFEEAYKNLKPEYQQIIRFRLFNKVSVKEISKITGQSEDSIDAMYRRALKKYREEFISLYNGATDLLK